MIVESDADRSAIGWEVCSGDLDICAHLGDVGGNRDRPYQIYCQNTVCHSTVKIIRRTDL
jgi:hypothetical protein